MKKPKTGRLINADERAIAASWVSMYRQAEQAPNQRICINPEMEPELQQTLDYNDPTMLLHLLETIASHGTMIDVKMAVMVNNLIANTAVKNLRKQGKTRMDAIEIVSAEQNVSVRTIERIIPKKDKKPPIRDTDCG
jgi:hypothetical protein